MSVTVIIDYKPHTKQKEVHQSDARYKVLNWGRRTGKSTLAIHETFKQAIMKKGRYWIISPTYKQSKNIYWRSLINQLPLEDIKRNETELIMSLPNGSLIELKGADQPDSLRGAGIEGVILDEYAFMKPDVWEEIIRPMLLDSKGWAIFISTPNGFNHFYELAEQAKDKNNWEYFHATTYDNPYIDEQELDEERAHTDPDTFAQEYLGEFKKVKGLVYPKFNRDIHVVKTDHIPTEGTRYSGIDFGFTNPTAMLFVIVDYDNNWFIYDEVYQSGMTTEQGVNAYKQKTASQSFSGTVGDSAAAQEIANWNAMGVYVKPIDKKSDSIQAGIQLIQDRLVVQPNNKPRLFVSEVCKNTIWEFETYRYEEQKEDKNAPEQPIKENDHAMDALRYLLLEFGKPEQSKPVKQREMHYDKHTGRLLS